MRNALIASTADWLSVTATILTLFLQMTVLEDSFDAKEAVSHPSFNANVSAAKVEHTTHLMRLEAQEIGEHLFEEPLRRTRKPS